MTGVISKYTRPGPESSRIGLVLLLLCFSSMILQCPNVATAGYYPQQASGTTWELLESDYPNALYRDVAFLNATHGWIVGQIDSSLSSDLIILHTNNNGDSWELQYNHSQGWVTIMDIVDEQILWINGAGRLVYTLNGGEIWNESAVSGVIGGLSTVKFINRTHGWTGNNMVLYQTIDGGESWSSVPDWNFNDTPRMIEILSPLDIWATGFSGVYHSIDGGLTWYQSSDGGGWAVSFVSETEGWVIGDNRLAHTTDGITWEELVVPMRTPAFRLRAPYTTDIQFLNEDNGWIVGTEISVMYTPDGGANWYEQSVPTYVAERDIRMMAVDFINQTHGWVVGDSGVIMRTTTGNSQGNRLWYGMSDPLFLSIIGVIAVGIVVTVGGLVTLRRQRGRQNLTATQQGPVEGSIH